MIRLGTLFSGIGAVEQALNLMNIDHANVFACDNGELELKLLPGEKQKEYDKLKPFKGCWAFLGGFMNMDETTEQCAIRELEEETGLQLSDVHQIGAYSKVNRDPRGRTITVAYLAIIDEPVAVTGQDDAAKAEWWPLSDLPHLAFDHYDIMQDAVKVFNRHKE